jgi:hypothetical protein
MDTSCERWNTKINEEKTPGIYFSRSPRPPESHLTSNGRDISFVNSVKYLGLIFDKKVIWRLHREMIKAKAFRTFIRIYSLLKSERLSTNIKLNLHKAVIRTIMTYACPAWEFAADNHLLKSQRLHNKVLRPIENFPRCTSVRDLHMDFKLPYIWLHNKIMQATSRSHTKSWKCSQHWARRTTTQGIWKIKLGGGQLYDRSSDQTAYVAATSNRAWSAVLTVSLDWQRPCICCIYVHILTCKMHNVQTDKRLIIADWLWQTTDPSSRQRERPTSTSLQLSDSNNDLVLSPRCVLYSKTDSPTKLSVVA